MCCSLIWVYAMCFDSKGGELVRSKEHSAWEWVSKCNQKARGTLSSLVGLKRVPIQREDSSVFKL